MKQLFLSLTLLLFGICSGFQDSECINRQAYCNDLNETLKASPPVEDIYAKVVVNEHDTKYGPSKLKQRESISKSYIISGQLKCNISRERILNYRNNPASRRECSANTHCPILDGASYYKERDPKDFTKYIKNERYPLKVSKDLTEMRYCTVNGTEQYIKTLIEKLEGTNKYEALSLEIKSYVPPEGSQLAPLMHSYVIWLTGSKYLDKMSMVPEGNGEGLRWDYSLQKLVPSQGPFSIGIPYSYSEPDRNPSLPDIYEPLLITDVDGLDKYLLNPSGEYSIEARGKFKLYDENNSEWEGEISVNITLSTKPEEIPPSEEDDPDF